MMATTRKEKTISMREANHLARGRARVSRNPEDTSIWLVDGDGWTEGHEPMTRAAWLAFLDKKVGPAAAKPKSYLVQHEGRPVRVTIPDRHDGVAYEGDLKDILRDVLKDSVSPQTIAALANAVRVQIRSGLKNPAIVKQLTWISKILLNMLGNQYQTLLDEAGVPGGER
ncbi:hypothetical protein ES708_32531 [subsurface metagenome]